MLLLEVCMVTLFLVTDTSWTLTKCESRYTHHCWKLVIDRRFVQMRKLFQQRRRPRSSAAVRISGHIRDRDNHSGRWPRAFYSRCKKHGRALLCWECIILDRFVRLTDFERLTMGHHWRIFQLLLGSASSSNNNRSSNFGFNSGSKCAMQRRWIMDFCTALHDTRPNKGKNCTPG